MSRLARLFGARPRPRQGDAAVSVVVPLHNHARYIGAALASVLAQTAPATEIVLIDDGSTDDGLRIAERALRGVADVRLLRQDNAGAHATLNRAAAMASGAWIAVLNSDDLFAPDKLERCQTLIAAAPETDLIAGGIALIDGAGAKLHAGVAADWLRRATDFAARAAHPPLALLNENFVATTSNMVFRRRLWERLGGFAPLRYCHDLDFLLRGFAHGRVMLDTAHLHVLYRVHGANTIGEDAGAVRAELAAVIAAAIRALGPRLLPDGADGAALFTEMLRNKAMSDAVLAALVRYDGFADVHAFYAGAAETARPCLAARSC